VDVSIANIVFYALTTVVPAALQADVQFLVITGVTAALSFLGKILRDKGLPYVPI
jgi:hypothetical protein